MLRQLVSPLLRGLPAVAPPAEASVACVCQSSQQHGGSRLWQQLCSFSSQQEAPAQSGVPKGPSTTGDATTSGSNSDNVTASPQQPGAPSSSAAAAASAPADGAASSGQSPASADTTSSRPATTTSYGPRLTHNKRASQFERVKQGIVHINSTLNNTLLVLTDMEGQVKACATGGTAGYRNSGKSTPTAAEQAARDLAQKAYQLGYSSVAVKLKGRGKNKQFAAAALTAGGLTVTSLQDITSIPHNGCRLPRKRRL